MPVRSKRERAIQTLSFELGGLLIAAPAYAALFGAGAAESLGLMAALSVAVMAWSPFHNSVFDWAEWRLARRLASDRPHGWRIVHAFSHETTVIAVTAPIIVVVGGLTLAEALALELGLTLFYVAYAYVFNLAFDRLRPVRPGPVFRSRRAGAR